MDHMNWAQRQAYRPGPCPKCRSANTFVSSWQKSSVPGETDTWMATQTSCSDCKDIVR